MVFKSSGGDNGLNLPANRGDPPEPSSRPCGSLARGGRRTQGVRRTRRSQSMQPGVASADAGGRVGSPSCPEREGTRTPRATDRSAERRRVKECWRGRQRSGLDFLFSARRSSNQGRIGRGEGRGVGAGHFEGRESLADRTPHVAGLPQPYCGKRNARDVLIVECTAALGAQQSTGAAEGHGVSMIAG